MCCPEFTEDAWLLRCLYQLYWLSIFSRTTTAFSIYFLKTTAFYRMFFHMKKIRVIRATQIITRPIIELLSCISHLEYWDKFTKKSCIKGRYPNLSSNPNLKIAAKTFRGCEKNLRLLAAPLFSAIRRARRARVKLMRAVTDRHTNGESRRCIPLNTTSSSKSKAKIWIQQQPQTRPG